MTGPSKNYTSTETEKLRYGSGGGDALTNVDKRKITNTQERVVTVPGDYSTIQAAVNDAPLQARYDYVIEVDTTNSYSSEDIVIEPTVPSGPTFGQGQCFTSPWIRPQNDADGPVEVGSVAVFGAVGPRSVQLEYVRATNDMPEANELAGIGFFGCWGGFASKLEFGPNVTNGVLSYNSDVSIGGYSAEPIDIGSGNVSNAFFLKRGGKVTRVGDPDGFIGTAQSYLYRVEQGGVMFYQDSTASGSLGTYDLGNGFAYNMSTGQLVTGEGVVSPGGIHQLDGTQTDQSVTSSSYSLQSSYDDVIVKAQLTNQAGTGNTIDLRVNGDSGGNYDYITTGGTESTGQTEIGLVTFLPAGSSRTVSFELDGRWAGVWGGGHSPRDSATSVAMGWENANVTSPLDTVTLVGSGSFDVSWEVYGTDIGSSGTP